MPLVTERWTGRARRVGATVLVTALLAAVSTVPGPGPVGAVVTPPLESVPSSTVTGTDGRVYMADAQGRALQFRGFNTGKEMTATVAEITPELMEAAADTGFDLMRLSWQWHKLEPTNDAWDEAYLGQVVAALDLAEGHGVSVILDNHQDVFGPAFGGNGVPEWATRDDGQPFVTNPGDPWFIATLQPAVQAAWEHLYEDADLRAEQIESVLRVVDRVVGHPALLGYDLLNEPFGKMRPGEDLLTAAVRVESTQLTAMYQRLADAIRTVDTTSWIFVHPPNVATLGARTHLGRIDDPKLAYYPHFYDLGLESGTTFDPASTFHATWEGVIGHYPETYDVPTLVGEWGLPDPAIGGAGTFIDRSLAVMERMSSGWTVFSWCAGAGYCVLDAAGRLDPAWQRLVQAWPRAIAGAPTSSRWDPATRALHVVYRVRPGTSGPTEIVVPPSLYPDGFTVETSLAGGTWTWEADEAAGRLRVAMPADGDPDRAICISPGGVPGGCVVPVEAPPDTDPVAPPAGPVEAEARFTG